MMREPIWDGKTPTWNELKKQMEEALETYRRRKDFTTMSEDEVDDLLRDIYWEITDFYTDYDLLYVFINDKELYRNDSIFHDLRGNVAVNNFVSMQLQYMLIEYGMDIVNSMIRHQKSHDGYTGIDRR